MTNEIINIPSYYTDFKNKSESVDYYARYMLNRTQSMFEYNNLPNKIPQRMLELYLQTNGNCIVADYNGELFAYTGGVGGVKDEYYRPTLYVVSNPYQNFSKSFKINDDCVIILNDSTGTGLMPMINRYSSLMADNEISMRMSTINSRMQALFKSNTDSGNRAVSEYLKKIERGDLSAVADNAFLESITVQPLANTNSTEKITDLIEFQQYLKASFFNEIGLDANYNMKRESLNSAETNMNNDALLPLAQDMLRCRTIAVERINDMFGTDISVSFSSSWAKNEIIQEQSIDDMTNNDDSDSIIDSLPDDITTMSEKINANLEKNEVDNNDIIQ